MYVICVKSLFLNTLAIKCVLLNIHGFICSFFSNHFDFLPLVIDTDITLQDIDNDS
jgi:hypothetical protein